MGLQLKISGCWRCIPPASLSRSRLRAICDERIALPLSACHSFPDIYAKLAAQLGQGTDLLEIKMALQRRGVLGLRPLAV